MYYKFVDGICFLGKTEAEVNAKVAEYLAGK